MTSMSHDIWASLESLYAFYRRHHPNRAPECHGRSPEDESMDQAELRQAFGGGARKRSEPVSTPKAPKERGASRNRDANHHKIAVGPFQLGNIIEIHPVNAR